MIEMLDDFAMKHNNAYTRIDDSIIFDFGVKKSSSDPNSKIYNLRARARPYILSSTATSGK
jgi:hypothetical protein